jgi:hypothetical protein
MDLRSPTPPPGTENALRSVLTRLNPARLSALGGAAPSTTPVAPHEVFVVGNDDLATGKGLAAARSSGWRVLLTTGQSVTASVNLTTQGGAAKFAGIHYGPFAQGAEKGIQAAEASSAGKSQHYELRVLEAPSIQLVSLWLHGSMDDLFVPLEPAPKPFQPGRVQSESDFFTVAAQLAKGKPGIQPPPMGMPPVPMP